MPDTYIPITAHLFILDFTMTMSNVLERNKRQIMNKRIIKVAKETEKLAKKEIWRVVRESEHLTKKNLKEVKDKVYPKLYAENQEFDILEGYHLAFLGYSELLHNDPDNKRLIMLKRRVLNLIKMFDPMLTMTDEQNGGWDKYEYLVRDIKDSWVKYTNYEGDKLYDQGSAA